MTVITVNRTKISNLKNSYTGFLHSSTEMFLIYTQIKITKMINLTINDKKIRKKNIENEHALFKIEFFWPNTFSLRHRFPVKLYAKKNQKNKNANQKLTSSSTFFK